MISDQLRDLVNRPPTIIEGDDGGLTLVFQKAGCPLKVSVPLTICDLPDNRMRLNGNISLQHSVPEYLKNHLFNQELCGTLDSLTLSLTFKGQDSRYMRKAFVQYVSANAPFVALITGENMVKIPGSASQINDLTKTLSEKRVEAYLNWTAQTLKTAPKNRNHKPNEP